MRSERERINGALWRTRFGGRRLGAWRDRVSIPLLAAVALCGLQRFVPALDIDRWLRTIGECAAFPSQWMPKPIATERAERESSAEEALDLKARSAALRMAEAHATAPRGCVVLDVDDPDRAVESLAPEAHFVEVLAKPAAPARWSLNATIGTPPAAEDARGAVAVWRQAVVGRVARHTLPGAPLELVLSITKGQRYPVVYRAFDGGIGSGVLVAGPFATPSGEEAAFRLLHPTSDPLSPEEPLRLSAGPEGYREQMKGLSQGGALAEEAKHFKLAEGFTVARFHAQRSFADGWYADEVFDRSMVHGVHLLGISAAACHALDDVAICAARITDASDIDRGTHSARVPLGAQDGLMRGDPVLADGLFVGDLSAVTPWSSRWRGLDIAGREFEALWLADDGELRFLGVLRSLGAEQGTWVLEAAFPLPIGSGGTLFTGAGVHPGWKGLCLGAARVLEHPSRIEVLARQWSLGDEVLIRRRGAH